MAYNNLRINGTDYPLGGGGVASWNNLADKPILTVSTKLFSDAEFEFEYGLSESGIGYWAYFVENEAYQKKWDSAWKRAIVTIDGVQYTSEKQIVESPDCVLSVTGDAQRMQDGTIGSGEPYCICMIENFLQFYLFTDSEQEEGAKETHTVSITLENDVIQSDYLPVIPEFDLTAMGLPAAGTFPRSVECDTTALRTALEKGPVKLNLQVYTSQTATADITFIGSAANLGGTYQLNYIGVFGGGPIMLIVVVTSTAISSWIIKQAVPASTDTTT